MHRGGTESDDDATQASDATVMRLASWDGESTRDFTLGHAQPAGSGAWSRSRAGFEGEPAPAMRIGRYGVLRELGRGGMGVTYIAYDEDLDRKVALKLVRSELLGQESQRRLRREAQALARLAHPNIVAVHDVGLHHGQAFIAMEFVSGQTVSAWAAARPRPWTDVVAMFCQAGEGLRVAHAAGMVHRDIKPANIIVGDDGRVRVLDFGLARQAVREGEREPVGALDDTVVDERLTSTGALVGTLRYMAPEHLDRGIADARSDQFSFCVSLFETLYGRAPFAGASPRARLAAMRRGLIAEVPGKGPVPRWLHVVIVRGLAFAPEARWPSMDALLAALAQDPTRTRRRRWAIGVLAAGLAALLTALIAGGLVVRDRRAAVCSSAGAGIDQTWSDEQRAAMERAMRATGVPYAADTWQRTRVLLDRYAADWAAAYTEACEATVVRQEQSEGSFDQRMQCLARRRRSLRALVDELQRIDAVSMARAILAAGRLPLIASCGDPEYLSGWMALPGEPALAGQVEAAEAALMRAEQLEELGRYEVGLIAAQAAFERAQAVGHAPLLSRARLRLGMLQLVTGAHLSAESNLREAYFMARTAGDHGVALQAAAQLVTLLGHHLSRPDDARDWSRHVQAELPWVRSEVEQASALHALAALALLQGRREEAMASCRQALVLWEQALGPDHPRVAEALELLGATLHAQERHREAMALRRRSMAIRERALGAGHPFVIAAGADARPNVH